MKTHLLLILFFTNVACGSAQTNVDKFKEFISNTPIINELKVNFSLLCGEKQQYSYTIRYESDEKLYWQENNISESLKESSRIYARDKLERWGYEGTQPNKTKYFYWNDSGNPDELNKDINPFLGTESFVKSQTSLFLHFGIPSRSDLPIQFDQDNKYHFQSLYDNSHWIVELVVTNNSIYGATCRRYTNDWMVKESRPCSQITIKYGFNNKGEYSWIPSSLIRSLQINNEQPRDVDRIDYILVKLLNKPLTNSDLNLEWAKNSAKSSQLIGNGISKLKTEKLPQYFKLNTNTNTGRIIIYPLGEPKINMLDETLQETLKTLKLIF